MTQYGDYQEPGIVTDLTSSAAVPQRGEPPTDVGLIGQADLSNATNAADTSKVYQVTRASKAVEWFGPKDSSMLTQGIIDALTEGAYPVYAVAAESTSVVGESHDSASSTSVSTDNAPIREDPDDITVTLDGTDQTVNVVYDDTTTYSPAAGECYVNPVRGNIEIESAPGTSLSFDYDHFDYESGIDVVEDKIGDVVDFLCPLNEKPSIVDKANTTVANMEQEYNLAIAIGGAEIHLDPTAYSARYDDSRTQVVYPTRFEDGSSMLAAYVGFRARLGLENTPINKRLTSNKRLIETLNRAQRGSLIDEDVVPVADDTRGARVVDDPTTVTNTNTDEQNLAYGFNRLLADYIIGTTKLNQEPFIGKLNNPVVRGVLEEMVNEQLVRLQESNLVLSYNVNVLKEDAVTAGVEMSVDLVEPLRFIDNTITITQGQ